MNYKFRKKPIIIEAFQMTRERRNDNSDWPFWLKLAWTKPWHEVGSVNSENWPHGTGEDRLMIHTLEGKMTVGWNDFIIQGVNGELYLCKHDIFEKTYEEVKE